MKNAWCCSSEVTEPLEGGEYWADLKSLECGLEGAIWALPPPLHLCFPHYEMISLAVMYSHYDISPQAMEPSDCGLDL